MLFVGEGEEDGCARSGWNKAVIIEGLDGKHS